MARSGRGDSVRIESIERGAIRLISLTGDSRMTRALRKAILGAARDPGVKGIVLQGAGPDFSYGVDIEEHLPGRARGMLTGFHAVFGALLEGSVPALAVVRGRCLGGGLELAAFCHRVFASPGAVLGQPEILLGVFPPAASTFLRERATRGVVEDLCLSGRSLRAREALAAGLVDVVDRDPFRAALAYARRHLLPRSASSLRHATRAVRLDLARRFKRDIAAQETRYLRHLMRTSDAVEGIRAFLDKRPPRWKNR